MRFRILCGKLLGGFKWVNGSSATIQKTSRPERNRPGSLGTIVEENAELKTARGSKGIYEFSTDDEDYLTENTIRVCV